MVFKSAKTGRIDSIPIADIKSTKWMRVARGFGLKISLNNGQHYKYDGFKEPVSEITSVQIYYIYILWNYVLYHKSQQLFNTGVDSTRFRQHVSNW